MRRPDRSLNSRLELAQRDRVMDEVVPRLSELAATAKRHNVALTVDAEEASRLEMTRAIFAVVFDNPAMQDWEGLGIAVQAYQRRARAVIKWLRELSERSGRRIPVRLV